MNIIGILSYGTNSSVCLVKDGTIEFIAEEERFTRVKNAPNNRPINAIKAALKYANITINEIDYVAVGWDHNKYPAFMSDFYKNLLNSNDFLSEAFQKQELINYNPDLDKQYWLHEFYKMGLSNLKAPPKIKYFSHHMSHAASAYFLSGFNQAIIISADGHGEENSTVVFKALGDKVQELERYEQPQSLGWFYSAFTEFLGFNAYSGEGKVMGLAPYGKPNLEIRNKINKVIYWENGQYCIDETFFLNGVRTYNKRFTDKLVDTFGEPRKPEADISEYHKELAFEVQFKLESIMKKIVTKHIDNENIQNICLTGGIALNCKMNGEVHKLDNVKEVFINPASNDAGVSIGAALLLLKELNIDHFPKILEHPYWGPEYSNSQIKEILDLLKVKYRYEENIEEITASKLVEGKIIGWFQGKMEIGSRALGNRSIIANPIIKDMKDKINGQVKFREYFRPFAPSILEEYQENYLINNFKSPFMILADTVKEDVKHKIPAVVHEDNSVRQQTVSKSQNEKYWNLINEFNIKTGVPLVLNTSLNVRGEPIAQSPLDAIKCFYSNGLDVLVIGNYVLEKEC